MFEITGSDIASLADADLRVLVEKLAIAELRKQNCPTSGVTAGGDQDAPDGGIDVRVSCNMPLISPDFVPRNSTGFQVKKSDMRAKAIQTEMRPAGTLREAIVNLISEAGAYVIVSAKSSVTDSVLEARRKAMRDALRDQPNHDSLLIDFYDQNRIANWANGYAGIVAWVRLLVGRGLTGWSGIENWRFAQDSKFLFDDNSCVIDERTNKHERITILEGISRLRESLRQGGQCVRLIGLSGVGKTRLVQALFQNGIGEEPIDASLAIYTDYSEDTVPAAREMARHLITTRQRAILVVDNCNPETHSELVRICSSDNEYVGLITVEYDVRGDEPERTDVFRLMSVSVDLLSEWLKQTFPDISEVDRKRIAEISDGNFRVAGAVAGTLKKGETLGQLKSRDLFLRIFQQRQDADKELLHSAQDLALLYSFDGESTSVESELSILANLHASGASKLLDAVVELRHRGVVQARGRWRAILPHAIANPLAASALERTTPHDFDAFCAKLPVRMLKSLSRRLSYLHDSPEGRCTARRWLDPLGPFGDLLARGDEGFAVLTNLAPVVPEVVLARIGKQLDQYSIAATDDDRGIMRFQWIGLLRALAYEPELFEEAAILLTKLDVVGSSANNLSSARSIFSELFHLHLSGTRASPKQRRDLIRKLAHSEDSVSKECASIALDSLLEAEHFTSSENFDFGARPRDWGWEPKIYGEIWDWYREGVLLCLDLVNFLPDIRSILAGHVRGIWRCARCFDELEGAAQELSREGPWIEGWLAFRSALRYDQEEMPEELRTQLVRIIYELRPVDPLSQARAAVLNRISDGWDLDDVEDADEDTDVMRPWHKAQQLAEEAGVALARHSVVRQQFLPEVLAEKTPGRAHSFGQGLAKGSEDLVEAWKELSAAYEDLDPESRNATTLGGFLSGANEVDQSFVINVLDSLSERASLRDYLPYFQSQIGVDLAGVKRLRKALQKGRIPGRNFFSISGFPTRDTPSDSLSELVLEIADLSDGIAPALDILHMRFHRIQDGGTSELALIKCGRILLGRGDLLCRNTFHDFRLKSVVETCLVGFGGRKLARQVCKTIRRRLDSMSIARHDVSQTVGALFALHPEIALDEFMVPRSVRRKWRIFSDEMEPLFPRDLERETLFKWANKDPDARYSLLGEALSMFESRHGEDSNKISRLFLDVLEQAPDKLAFLGDFWQRIYRSSYIGNLADVLISRRAQIKELKNHPDPVVLSWIEGLEQWLDGEIERERGRNRQKEESFE